MSKSIFDSISYYTDTTIDYPGYIGLIVYVKDCNMSCNYCYNIDRLRQSDERINHNEIIDAITSSNGFYDTVTICGGEPTLYDDLPNLIDKLKDNNVLVKVDTNGTNINNIGKPDYIALDYKWNIENYIKYGKYLPDNLEEFIKLVGNKIDGQIRTVVTLSHDRLAERMYQELLELKASAEWKILEYLDNEFVLRRDEVGLFNDKDKERYDIILNTFQEYSKKFNGGLNDETIH